MGIENLTEASILISLLMAKGYSKYRISKKLKVSWRSVHLWFKGYQEPNEINIVKIRRLYNDLHSRLDRGQNN